VTVASLYYFESVPVTILSTHVFHLNQITLLSCKLEITVHLSNLYTFCSCVLRADYDDDSLGEETGYPENKKISNNDGSTKPNLYKKATF
jgi:hypothetical protein